MSGPKVLRSVRKNLIKVLTGWKHRRNYEITDKTDI